MPKKKYKLESVTVTGIYSGQDEGVYIVTERWVSTNQWEYHADYEYKYVLPTLERAMEMAKKRMEKFKSKA